MFQDKTLQCKECGSEFVFTAGEQEFHSEKGFENDPKRCPDCRKKMKESKRVLYTATCAECGSEAKIPFEPKTDRPVYCSDCFAKMKNNG